MSHWNIGADDVSEETQMHRNKLASKDSQIAAQQTQLLKQTKELDDLRTSLHDALYKLSTESDRALRLETDLLRCNDDLRNEKLVSQNAASSLLAANEQIKTKELENKELLSNLDHLSRQSDGHTMRATKLEKEKNTLEARMKELEVNLRDLSSTPVSPPARHRSLHRGRSSSLSNLKISTLEIELADVKAALAAKEGEVRVLSQKVGNEAMKIENEKIAMERAAQKQLDEMQALLEEREEELDYLRGGSGGGSEREEDLLRRIDEDGAKIDALELLLGDADDAKVLAEKLKVAEHRLQMEMQKVFECTSRQVQLVQEKEQALDELEEVRERVSFLEQTVHVRETHVDALKREVSDLQAQVASSEGSDRRFSMSTQQTVQDIERLLSAVNRLRNERDDLRRKLRFLETESRFTAEALEAKRESEARTVVDASRHRDQIARTNLTVGALSIVVGYFAGQDDIWAATSSFKDADLQAVREKLKISEVELAIATQTLEDITLHRDELEKQFESSEAAWMKELEEVKAAHEETKDSLDRLDSHLTEVSATFEEVECERDSLAVQVANLTTDLATAQADLNEAESRYSSLQFHQLSNMSSNEATRTLSGQIEELEKRVMRRTEQIGIHQHDIKRLETNMRLQEERIGELTAELEMLASQKDAMVEDCADAREARDDAVAKFEAIEIEVEALREEAAAAETLVRVIFDVAGNARSAVKASTEQTQLAEKEVERLAADRLRAMQQAEQANTALLEAQTTLASSQDAIHQTTLALANSQIEVRRLVSSGHSLDEAKADFEDRLRGLQDELAKHLAEKDALANQLRDVQVSETTSRSQVTELQIQVQSVEDAMTAMESTHRAALKDLQTQLASKDKLLMDNNAEHEQLVSLKVKHVEEMGRLQSHLVQLTSELEETKTRQEAAEAARVACVEELAESRAEVEKQLLAIESGLRRNREISHELEKIKKDGDSEKTRLDKDLEAVKEDLRATKVARDALDARYQKEISQHQTDSEARLHQLDQQLAELRSTLEEQKQKHDSATREAEGLRSKLIIDARNHTSEQEARSKELKTINERYSQAEELIEELKEEVATVRKELTDVRIQVESLQTENTSYQQDNTGLEAENQRSLSLIRYLESQVKELEQTVKTIETDNERCRALLTRAEKAASTAEVSLSMQNSHHKREIAEMQRELAAFKTKPNLDTVIAHLEERNNEMEELLRAKCAEIEENDDRTLDMLKENKKLTSKVESLSRKVQNLQAKLAAAKASATKNDATEPAASQAPAHSRVSPPLAQSSSRPLSVSHNVGHAALASSSRVSPPQSSFPRARSNTVSTPTGRTFSAPASSSQGIPPSVSRSLSSRTRPTGLSDAATPSPANIFSTPRSLSRAPSQSSLPRPKTPERHAVSRTGSQPLTPNRRADVPDTVTSSAIGKKRAAPDDFADCDAVPPQGFTVDSLPGDRIETGTPRLRKVMNSINSGFTPVRHQLSRPIISLSPKRSPKRRAKPSPFMSDVTNNPHTAASRPDSEDKPLKSSWLGRIRGASSAQGTERTVASQERY
ncbi:uncharacterized protein ARMOST_09701 [Armillaria ostoyae]|uniref:Uncharacterized protein n=1 Tax=Armillaria ostoyae TaxID=47428 RepID=A0A284RCA7_ARMOS|nr:uncharacterized protein ARMOST_09701 [Armillaria ostoyae]